MPDKIADRESSESDTNTHSLRQTLFLLLNVANHGLIIIVTVYVTYMSLELRFPTDLHALLCTIGYVLLMAEAIVALTGENILSRHLTRRYNSHVHWILQVVGAIFSIAGALVMYIAKLKRQKENGTVNSWITFEGHFMSWHGFYGIISVAGICIVFLSGLPALFAARLRKTIKPVYSKILHNLLGMSCFILGIVAQCYGYQKRWLHLRAPSVVVPITVATAMIAMFSLIGALRQLRQQSVGIYRSCMR